MSVIAAIRDDAVNLPLFLHVLGAMVLTGVLLTSAGATLMAGRGGRDAASLSRFGFKAVLFGALPAYLLMRVGAQWTEAEENLPPAVEDQAWLTIGYITADLGALLILVSMVVAAVGLRRLRAEGGAAQARAIGIISAVLLALFLVAVWAMTAKPA